MKKRPPEKWQIQDVIEYMLRHEVGGFPTRTLAWCAGELTDAEYYPEVAKYIKQVQSEQKRNKRSS